MLMNPLRYCFFSILFILFSCAPKTAPPPLYSNIDLSLQDIIALSRRDITGVKAITSIRIYENSRPHSEFDALLLLNKPDSLELRLYKYGFLAGNLSVKEGVILESSGKAAQKLRDFGPYLYDAVFWWEHIDGALLVKRNRQYRILSGQREIYLDTNTILPVTQILTVYGERILISYDNPAKLVRMASLDDGDTAYWYPATIIITAGRYRFEVEVEKLSVNPQ